MKIGTVFEPARIGKSTLSRGPRIFAAMERNAGCRLRDAVLANIVVKSRANFQL